LAELDLTSPTCDGRSIPTAPFRSLMATKTGLRQFGCRAATVSICASP